MLSDNTLNSMIAKPGDPDLDLDLDGVVITSVVHVEHDWIVGFGDGFGMFVDRSGDVVEFDPAWSGEPSERSGSRVSGEIVFGLACGCQDHVPSGVCPFESMVSNVLGRWHQTRTPLRMVAAPGRMTLLIENADLFLPIPRGGSGGSGGS